MHWNVGVENSVLQDIPLLFIYEFENGLSIWPEPPEQTFLYVMSHAQRQQTKMPEAAVHSGAKHPKIQRFTFNIRYPLLRQSAKMSVQELKRIQSPHREYHPGFFFFFCCCTKLQLLFIQDTILPVATPGNTAFLWSLSFQKSYLNCIMRRLES